jgi:alkanesulfonate monooxygenase SsuD/methylene tetrahydromethanopterin reductase-like flavin-dependent oxidoreductase (luciferase family)
VTLRDSRFEFGVDTFGDVTRNAAGELHSHAHVLRDVVEQAVIAEQAGLDCFGVGEHHRDDFAISAPEVMLAAIASRTSRMWLGSAVTVLSTDDPVRVFQRFSTLNAISSCCSKKSWSCFPTWWRAARSPSTGARGRR